MNLEKIIRENIQKKIIINENFEKISLLTEEEDRFHETINYLNHLINEGYSEPDIENLVTEKWDFLKNLLGLEQKPTDTTGDTVIKTAGSGAVSGFTEYIIKYILSMVGFKGPLASSLSTFISEMSFTELVALIKGEGECTQHSGQIAKAIMESLVTFIIQTNTKKDSMIHNFLRNTLFEYLNNEGYTKKVGDVMCKVLYKKRTSLLNF